MGTVVAENKAMTIVKYSPKDKAFRKMMLAMCSASILTFANLYFVQPMLPLFVKSFHISSTTAGLSLSISVIAMMIGLLFFGFLADRSGRVVIMNITLICSIIPLIFMPLVSSFSLLLVLRFIQGFFIAGLPAAAIAYISEEVAPPSIGLGITLYIAANGLGGMAGRILVGYVADVTSWQTAIYVLFGVGFILYLLFRLFLPKSRSFEPSTISVSEDIRGMFVHLKNPLLIPAFTMGVILQFSFTGVWTYLPFYLEGEPFRLAVKDVSFTYLAYMAGIIGSIVAGRISAMISKTTLVITGTLILIAGTWLTLIPSLTVIVIGLCFVCLGFFIAHSLMSAIVNERAAHHKGGASSLYLTSYYVGVATGGVVSGLIWSRFGWTGVAFISCLLIPIVVWVRRGKRNK